MVVRRRSSILRQTLILISQPSNALTAIRLIPPIWISHNFKATTLGMTRKTMRNQGFEPWTFRSCLGYQHFVINDNNRDQRKKDSKKTSIATVAEIKTEANVAEKASALVAATNHGDHMTFDSRQVSPLRPSSQKIVSTTNVELGEYHKEIQTLDYDYHISKENESGQSNYVQEALADPRWKATMNEEMKSLQKNETWELVECPPGKKPVGCRWIYTVKYKADVIEEVYMDLPPGCMVSEKQCRKVCKLKKSLYGLKQSQSVVWKVHKVNESFWLSSKNIYDVDWAVMDDRRSTSGYFTFVGGDLVTWKSKKRMSSLVQVTYLGNQSNCFVTIKSHVTLLIIRLQHDRTKHVEVDRFFIKEKLDDKIVELPKIRSKINWSISLPKSQVKCSQNF
ncbi:hypothetical protein AAG906_015924 [Vitis piasezkii]